MRLNRLVMALSLTTFAGCDVEALTSVTDTTEALETAQTDFCAFRAQADACRQAFDACVAVEGADVEACRVTLHGCLPPPPERRERGGGHCEGMGDGGVRPPRPEGGEGHPFGPPPGGPRPGGRGGHGGPGPHPEPAAVQACRDALTACLAADPADTTCVETERTCVREAFRAAFDAACADATATCATLPAEACTRLTERCAQGIDGRIDSDGGVCTAPPVVP